MQNLSCPVCDTGVPHRAKASICRAAVAAVFEKQAEDQIQPRHEATSTRKCFVFSGETLQVIQHNKHSQNPQYTSSRPAHFYIPAECNCHAFKSDG